MVGSSQNGTRFITDMDSKSENKRFLFHKPEMCEVIARKLHRMQATRDMKWWFSDLTVYDLASTQTVKFSFSEGLTLPDRSNTYFQSFKIEVVIQ